MQAVGSANTRANDFAEIELDFDLRVTGFETAEIDVLVGDSHALDAPDPTDAPV